MGKFAQGYVAHDRVLRHPKYCKVGTAYRKEFDAEDRAWFDGLMLDTTQSAIYIAEHLRKNGIEVSSDVVRRHRRGDCCCVRTQ
jgi:hypothetical protein